MPLEIAIITSQKRLNLNMRSLLVATQNPGKLAEMQFYLKDLPWKLELMPHGLDINETGSSFRENAAIKAKQAAQTTGQWAIADDSGLEVKALNGAPGIYSARYAKTDHERINRILSELKDQTNRAAQFVCAIAISDPSGKIMVEGEGICKGEILHQPRGEGGFGYDPIFWVPDCQQSYAEMTKSQKRAISHRGKAFDSILPSLKKLQTTL